MSVRGGKSAKGAKQPGATTRGQSDAQNLNSSYKQQTPRQETQEAAQELKFSQSMQWAGGEDTLGRINGLEDTISRLELENDNLKPLLKVQEQLKAVQKQESNVRSLMNKSQSYEDKHKQLEQRLAQLDSSIAQLNKAVDYKIGQEKGDRSYDR